MKTVNSDHEGCVGVASEVLRKKVLTQTEFDMNDDSVANVGNCC